MVEKIGVDLKQLVDCDDYYVANVEYVFEDNMNILRVSIASSVKTVDIDMCVEATHIVNDYLDTNNPIDEEYYLEVSSVGLSDVIDDLDAAIGEKVVIKTYAKVHNSKMLIGILSAYDDDKYYIELNGKTVEVDKKLVSQIKYQID